MTTIAKNFGNVQSAQYSGSYTSNRQTITLADRYNLFIEKLKFSHFAVMSIAILFGSCLGSIAAMYVFVAGAPIWVFAIGLFASLGNLVAAISQAPTKWVVNMFALSLLVNISLILFFIL